MKINLLSVSMLISLVLASVLYSSKQRLFFLGSSPTVDSINIGSKAKATVKNENIEGLGNPELYIPATMQEEAWIGVSEEKPGDNPVDNVFHITLPILSPRDKVWLEFEMKGIAHFLQVPHSINDQNAIGGTFVEMSDEWTKQKEAINPQILRSGDNVIRFSIVENAKVFYQVKKLGVRVRRNADDEPAIIVNSTSKSFAGKSYIQGFISGGGVATHLMINGQKTSIQQNGSFEITDSNINNFGIKIEAQLIDGKILNKNVSINQLSSSFHEYSIAAAEKGTTGRFIAGQPFGLHLDNVELEGAAGALSASMQLFVNPLRYEDMAPLEPDMINVTSEHNGFRFLPHGIRFSKNVAVQIGYDTSKIPEGYNEEDIRTYYFDESINHWMPLDLDTIDMKSRVIRSKTTHFTDMINGIIKVPESPETQGYIPTSIKDIKAANPAAGIQLIEAPSANQMGTANLNYPILLPAGRHGMMPGLSINYNSGSGNSWMGIGWNLSIPAISIDTRWGVPRYDASLETETYTMMGEQLTPVAYRSEFHARSSEKIFHQRIEGSFMKIVRHGNNPKEYWWEVTDKSGTKYSYGGTATSGLISADVLKDDDQNIGYWALAEVRDLNRNFVKYTYTTVSNAGAGGDQGRELYIDKITYTGHDDIPGKYSVQFFRDRQFNETLRKDVQVNCRLGFKQVSTDLLRKIEIKFNNQAIRSYEFAYNEAAFYKTQLKSITQFDAAGNKVGTHDLTYFDEVRQNQQLIPLTDAIAYNPTSDNIHGEFISTDKDKATVLGASEGQDIGGGLYVGFGFNPFDVSTNLTAGFHYNYSQSENDGRVVIIDLNGDGLPDKVFEKGGSLSYRPQLHNRQFGNAIAVTGADGILNETSETNSVGSTLR